MGGHGQPKTLVIGRVGKVRYVKDLPYQFRKIFHLVSIIIMLLKLQGEKPVKKDAYRQQLLLQTHDGLIPSSHVQYPILVEIHFVIFFLSQRTALVKGMVNRC